MIAVVDYHKGNLKSVERGLVAAGAEVLVTSDPAAIAKADAIVLPGVGAFADAAATMRELGQMDAIRERIAAGVPFLGICLECTSCSKKASKARRARTTKPRPTTPAAWQCCRAW